MSATFVPVVPVVNGADSKCVWQRAPKMSTTNLDSPHYGLSFLFVKPLNFANVISLNAVITARIEFFTYSGNQGIGSKVDINALNKRMYKLPLFDGHFRNKDS